MRDMRLRIKAIWDGTDDGLDNKSKAMLVAEIRDECNQYVKSIQLSQHTAYRLLLAIEEPNNKDISRSLFYMLFSLPNQSFLDLLEKSRTPIYTLTEDENAAGSIEIYGFRFRKMPSIPPALIGKIC